VRAASSAAPAHFWDNEVDMDDATRERFLKIALVVSGVAFFSLYPLGIIWPSGWIWHGGHGQYYLQMLYGVYAVLGAYIIAAARNPSKHRSLISFTVWSSMMHAGIMAARLCMMDTRSVI
jgi:hypothetical protein